MNAASYNSIHIAYDESAQSKVSWSGRIEALLFKRECYLDMMTPTCLRSPSDIQRLRSNYDGFIVTFLTVLAERNLYGTTSDFEQRTHRPDPLPQFDQDAFDQSTGAVRNSVPFILSTDVWDQETKSKLLYSSS